MGFNLILFLSVYYSVVSIFLIYYSSHACIYNDVKSVYSRRLLCREHPPTACETCLLFSSLNNNLIDTNWIGKLSFPGMSVNIKLLLLQNENVFFVRITNLYSVNFKLYSVNFLLYSVNFKLYSVNFLL